MQFIIGMIILLHLMYTNNVAKIQPLQTVLRQILLLNESYANGNGGVQGGYGQSSADQVKYAVIIVSNRSDLVCIPIRTEVFREGCHDRCCKGLKGTIQKTETDNKIVR